MGCQSVCTSLAVQGKVNSSGGHSLICNAWADMCKRARLCATSHNQWYRRDWERERRETKGKLSALQLLSLLLLSLFISPSFYQHLLRRRSLLASTVIHHHLNSWPVLCYFCLIDPAKTKTEEIDSLKNKADISKEKRKHGWFCATLGTLSNHAIRYGWSP